MRPFIWMLASTVIYGLYPLVAYSAKSEAHPILLIALAHFSATLVQFVSLAIAARREGKHVGEVFASIGPFKKIYIWGILQGVVHSLAHISLFAAFIFLDKYAAALVYDAWPILMIIMAAIFLPGKKLPTVREGVFISLSFLGLFIILESKIEVSLSFYSILNGLSSGQGLGASIALISMVGMAFTAVAAVRLEGLTLAAYRYRSMYSDGSESNNFRVVGSRKKPFSSAIVSPLIGNGFSMVFSAVIAWTFFSFSEYSAIRDSNLSSVFMLGLAAGVIAATAQICFIVANRSTKLTSINVLYNLTPLFGILFLYLFGENETISGQILLGGMLVIAANLAISVDSEITLAYYVSIAAICIVAVYCFFVPGIGIDSYYSAIAVPAGIFAILIAFMTERLSVRQLRQEDLAIKIFELHRSEGRRSDDINELREVVSEVLVSSSAQRVRRSAAEFIDRNMETSARVSSLMARLATNRLRIFGFGEIFVLWLVGSATLGLAVFGRPSNIEANMLAVVLAATVSFLCVLIVEPVSGRRANLLFSLLGQLPESDRRHAGRSDRDSDFLVLACMSGVFASVLFFLFFLAIAQKVS